ncbi:MAG: hypothetical protein E6I07_09615 [Chloroflexi bacterium]|nr:MAG: hypothetical protein E6I07_09615 [Chloroflexota bacterium]
MSLIRFARGQFAFSLIQRRGGESMAQIPTTATTSRVREVTAGFSKSHNVDAYFADDAEYDVLPLGQHYQGKEQIKGLFQVFYRDAFSPARAEIQNVIADAETRIGVLEFTFKGKHVGAQLGFPATNKEVELPMVAVYHVDGDRIRKARLYFDAAAFMRQLGM